MDYRDENGHNKMLMRKTKKELIELINKLQDKITGGVYKSKKEKLTTEMIPNEFLKEVLFGENINWNIKTTDDMQKNITKYFCDICGCEYTKKRTNR